MSFKRTLSVSTESVSKRPRKSVTLEVKLNVIQRIENGERAIDVSRKLNLPPTTVRSIYKNADQIRQSAERGTPLSSKKITRQRSSVMETMERLLSVWIDDMFDKKTPVNQHIIMAMARTLHEDLRKNEGQSSAAEETFTASRGWFARFRKRYSLHKIDLAGEVAGEYEESDSLYEEMNGADDDDDDAYEELNEEDEAAAYEELNGEATTADEEAPGSFKQAAVDANEKDANTNIRKNFKEDSNSFTYRSHNCGELRKEHEGLEVTLCGWVQFQRMGMFATLRDAYGVTQIISQEKNEYSTLLSELSFESVVQIQGVVVKRPPGQENPKMITGDIEVVVKNMKVLNVSRPQLPFTIRDFHKVKEPLRLKYRYLDLRNKKMQEHLRFRSDFIMKIREFLCRKHGFVDIETPILFRRTPGGAQEYVVPTNIPGKFYSLTQSPQQFKQLLMVGGMDRYFQIARCYRDEGGKPDRQPEFTQVDLEMSFVNQDNILSLVEALMHFVWPSSKGQLKIPFERMTYNKALEEYGTDKPDTRFDMKLQDLTDLFKTVDGSIFTSHLLNEDDRVVKAFVIKQGNKYLTKQNFLHFKDIVWKEYQLEDIFHVKIIDDCNWTGSISKQIPKITQETINQHLKVSSEDCIIMASGLKDKVCCSLGTLRLKAADLLQEKGNPCRDPKNYNFLWVTDFPLFLKNEDGIIESAHHPFTAPNDDDIDKLYTDPLNVRSKHYDLVLNGNEIGGGSIRIHDSQMQQYVLSYILQEDASDLFYMMEALESGCPPHGGIALGLDRLVAILCDASSIRDVIAFPKSKDGRDLMADAPSTIKLKDYARYHLIPSESISSKADVLPNSENVAIKKQ